MTIPNEEEYTVARVEIEKKVLSENDRIAADIRSKLAAHRILALNLVSSPGSGKTSLLEKTLAGLGPDIRLALIAGDVQTENDAERLKAAGGKVVYPIVTRGACHLDASMVLREVDKIDLSQVDLLFIENVGNLVCPSSYDLGEKAKVVVVSVTEGEDKPLKYPGMFRRSSLMIINKLDLLPHCDFNLEKVEANARQINGQLEVLRLSCRTGEGLDGWFGWLKATLRDSQAGSR